MFFRAMQYVASLKDEKKEHKKKGWVIDGKWCGPKRGSRIGRSKGDRKAQGERKNLKKAAGTEAGERRGHGEETWETIRKHNQTTVSKSHMDETSLAWETKASGGDRRRRG